MITEIFHRILRWSSIPLLLLFWQWAVASGRVESRLLPSLGQVLQMLASDISNGTLPYHAGITISRAMTGFVLAAVFGILFAAAMARSLLVRNLFEPIFLFGYPVPKIALFPVFTYVLGIGSSSKIAFAFLECLYPIVVASHLSFRAIPTQLIWAAENMGTPRQKLLWRVIFPSAMPGIFTGLRIALPASIVVIVLTEMIGDSKGLGYYLAISGTRFDFAAVYAAILVTGICGFLIDQALLWFRSRLVHWERNNRGAML